MSDDYRIAIQILSYNKPNYLVQTLDSLMKVKGPTDKIMVFEQSNTEELRQEGLAVCKEYDDVQVILSKENLGQRGATNKIIESGFYDNCKYIMLSDHDNLFHESLDLYVDVLNSKEDIWVATGYNSPEHDIENKDGAWLLKTTARAGHMVLRRDDFMSLAPLDEKIGLDNGCAWFAGLDWLITHWHPLSPGSKRFGAIAAYPGGVEHIGRESTWQGKYDDEYTVEENLKFRNLSMDDILKFYKPRHAYQTDVYWYEDQVIVESTPTSRDEIIKSMFLSNFDKKLTDKELTLVNGFWKDSNKPPLVVNGNIIAFNYLWPSYGFYFLKQSIESILPFVDKYVLYLNKYSYIGEECPEENLKMVNKIISDINSDKIVVHLNNSSVFPQVAKLDNISYYIRTCIDQYNADSGYIWLVQSDEIYDANMAEDIVHLCKTNSIKSCLITQPICYMDNPHWLVNPNEDFNRPTVILNDVGVDLSDKELRRDITFHHLSYVLTNDEIRTKFRNWGHRDDVNTVSFLQKFNRLKTNKFIQGLHPIHANVYRGVAFQDMTMSNRNMFIQWMSILFNKIRVVNLASLNKSMYDNLIPSRGTLLSYNTPIIDAHSKHTHHEIGVDSMSNAISNTFQGGTIKKHVPSFPLNILDMVILRADDYLAQNIIEVQPKIKDFGWYAIYYRTDTELETIQKFVKKATLVDVPWGQEVFRFFEIYYDILSDCNIDIDDYRLCIARLRKM